MADKNQISDYQDDWSGGVNAGISPKRIGANQAADAVNLSFRGGQPHPRPAFFSVLNLPSGIYQGGVYYNTVDADYFVAVFGGQVYVIEPGNNFEITNVTPDGIGNEPNIPMCYLAQADKFCIIQDEYHVPIVLMGKISKRADGVNPIPIGGVMTYGQGRLWVAIGSEFLASDLIGSEDNAVLNFSESTYLNEGGSFKLPAAFGNVVGMKFIAQQDTGTGQGSLIVFGEYGVASVNALIPRDQWKNTQIQQITLPDIGATGQRQLCNVNGDLFFRSHDGWRFYRQARAQINGINQVPISAQVQPYIDKDRQESLRYVSAAFFDNRLLMTSGPTVSNNRASHFGLLSLDSYPLSNGIGSSSAPAWEGFWELPGKVCELLTGVFNGRKRCFAVCIVDGHNVLYEVMPEGSKEHLDNGTTAINWSLTTRRFPFVNQSTAPHMEKRLVLGGEIRVSDRIGATTLGVDYRQDDSCQWKLWQTFSATGLTGNCIPDNSCSIPCPPCYYDPKLTFGDPPPTNDPITKRDDDRFYDMQFRLRGTGWQQIEHLRPQAIVFNDQDERGNPAT